MFFEHIYIFWNLPKYFTDLFNLRGSDISYNPVFFAYAIVTLETVYLFIESSRIESEGMNSLRNAGISVHPYESVQDHINGIVSIT